MIKPHRFDNDCNNEILKLIQKERLHIMENITYNLFKCLKSLTCNYFKPNINYIKHDEQVYNSYFNHLSS